MVDVGMFISLCRVCFSAQAYVAYLSDFGTSTETTSSGANPKLR